MGNGGNVTDPTPAAPPGPDVPVAYAGDSAVQQEWDGRYAEMRQLWSGRPNGALVAEVSDLAPGRVLDVGCGEGADAVWLARRGWDVTALDVSGVALARAAEHASEAGVDVRWVHAGLVEAALPASNRSGRTGSIRPTTCRRPWSPRCSTTAGTSRSTSSARGRCHRAAPARTTPTTSCSARAGCADVAA